MLTKIRKRRVLKAARRLVERFGERNLRRPFSFGVPDRRRDWYERNMDRIDRLFHNKPPFRKESRDAD